MLIAQRYETIVSLVNEKGSVRVSELSELCKVTEETIRRDLDKLEQAGKLMRSHGGAVALRDQATVEIPYAEREIRNVEEKKQIAEAAIRFIEPGDRIILDASSTAWYTAMALPNMPLTVLTNSIKVAVELSVKDQIEVVSTGGTLTARSLSFVGPLAEQALSNYHVNKAFISCKGIHAARGVSESNEWQAGLKKKMIDFADRVFLLADHSKFGIQAFAFVAPLDRVDVLITDGADDGALSDEWRKLGIQVVNSAALSD